MSADTLPQWIVYVLEPRTADGFRLVRFFRCISEIYGFSTVLFPSLTTCSEFLRNLFFVKNLEDLLRSSRPPGTDSRPSVYILIFWMIRRPSVTNDHGLSSETVHEVDGLSFRPPTCHKLSWSVVQICSWGGRSITSGVHLRPPMRNYAVQIRPRTFLSWNFQHKDIVIEISCIIHIPIVLIFQPSILKLILDVWLQ